MVCDPHAANDYAVFVDGARRPDGVRVNTHDIDLGAVDGNGDTDYQAP